ncbi:hypothetical protein VC83_07210 [Pseudogymnoascus destructans]|uniref:RING-type E3 ubiquitin transferase n=2 Tax=Pseudogymnoascus destructans TaxID=655981 RepID=L8FSH3_PSED2|nr:uncharacterized protein VC83_07210 [Pseudogymnoascus destructans]ELR03428.1 hypothetical protein GMDG_06163 [Pseudogymnoascus destructans 20631-21]OAF56718.1 hypothetical protein VC83_07210 [Pseudogymnoascus destructans]
MDDAAANPATKSQVLQTTLIEITARAGADADPNHLAEECCVICLDHLTDLAQALPCRHASFDFICLASWLQERSSCPLCNAEVSEIHYAFTNESNYKVYPVTSTTKSATPSSNPPLQRSVPHRPSRPRRQYTHNPTPAADDALARRRAVYAQNLYSLHIGTNRISRFRDFTPQSLSASPKLQSRARTWIRRELRVFAFLHPKDTADGETTEGRTRGSGDNAEFLLEYIIAILKTVDVQGAAGQAEELLREFLGREHARLFLHEVRAWLRSPYGRVEDWDRNVQYAVPVKVGEGRGDGGEGGGARDGRRGRSDRYTPYGGGRRGVEETRRRYNPD